MRNGRINKLVRTMTGATFFIGGVKPGISGEAKNNAK
jgi:hypothetical protein